MTIVVVAHDRDRAPQTRLRYTAVLPDLADVFAPFRTRYTLHKVHLLMFSLWSKALARRWHQLVPITRLSSPRLINKLPLKEPPFSEVKA